MAKKEHLEHRFNLVDLLIVLALAFAIGVLVFVMLGNDILSVTSDKTQVNYSLSISNEQLGFFDVGDEVFTAKGKSCGIITGKTVAHDGGYIIFVSANGYFADGDLFINGQKLAQNESFKLRLDDKSVITTMCLTTTFNLDTEG